MTRQSSIIADNVKIGKDVKLGNFLVIEEGCVIGDGVTIGDRATLHQGTRIGNNCVIQESCIIGKQPRPGPRTSHKIETQPGTVIGNKVLVGAFTCVYAGTVVHDYCLIGDFVGIREKCDIGEFSTVGRGVLLEFGVITGHHVRIMNNAQITEGTKIGNNVFVAPDVSTMTDKKMARDDNIFDPPVFKDNSRIGSNSIILPGVTVGFEGVVGAGSVVRENVGDHRIVMGNPAKFVGIVMKKDRLKVEASTEDEGNKNDKRGD
jgi:UDP-3-O-[3-hydroxymyristoyl] glucosamine N-acyltransferase